MRGRMRLRTEKGTKVADNLLHISSYRALNNTHRALKRSWLNNAQTLPFCFCPILITSCLRTKDTWPALHAIHIRVPREPGNEAMKSPGLPEQRTAGTVSRLSRSAVVAEAYAVLTT